MSPLVAKETRLLLPAYGMALLLAVAPVWLLPNDLLNTAAGFVIGPFCFGTVMLALCPFGGEFRLKTFPLLLAQPLARSRIWWTKVTLLACASTTLFGAWCLSCEACLYRGLGRSIPQEGLLMAGAIVITTFAGALWTTLLVRQVVAAFWLTILVPMGIGTAVSENGGTDRTVLAALGLYSAVGFAWAWWQFRRAQETAWTGGIITLAGRPSESTASIGPMRTWHPITALFAKELQLHQMTLVGMGALFVLHLGVLALRRAGPHAYGELIQAGLESYFLLWLVVSLFAGSQSVAEERKLGTMEAHMCLPVSSRVQYVIKLAFVLVLGGLLTAMLLRAAERIGLVAGVTGLDFVGLNTLTLPVLSLFFIAISVVAFYASTLSRNLLQALAVAVVTGIAFTVPLTIIPNLRDSAWTPWRGSLANYVEWPVLVGTLLWLGYRNFRSLSENWRFWLRNILGLTTAMALIIGLTAGVYHRAWEFLTPLEPAHGPARLTGVNRPMLHRHGLSFVVLLPDGRLWEDQLVYRPGRRLMAFGKEPGFSLGGKWSSMSRSRFIEGSNWVQAADLYRDNVLLRADGTLWVSERPHEPFWLPKDKQPTQPDKLVQFGEATNWIGLVRDVSSLSVLLLKGDGTLWRWGTNYFDSRRLNWPGLRSFEPYRLGEESDWDRILSVEEYPSRFLWKKDGQAFVLTSPSKGLRPEQRELEPGRVIQRWQALDKARWRMLRSSSAGLVGLREDGTLWLCQFQPAQQIGQGTNWLAVAGGNSRLVALGAEGTLWEWEFHFVPRKGWVITDSPARLGTHNDWVAIASMNYENGIVSLAADGSIWVWDFQDRDYGQPPLRASRRPALIDNIFGKEK